jgi:hypothetical protein
MARAATLICPHPSWRRRMGSKLLLVVGVALLLPLQPAAADAPYPIRLDGGRIPAANQPLSLTVVGPSADLGPNLVQNADFSQGTPPWRRSTVGDLGPRAVATVDGGTALLSVAQAPGNGLAYLSQPIPFPGSRPFRVSYRALDEGTSPTPLLVQLRESYANGTTLDTRFTHPAPAAWTTYNWTWTPRSTDARTLTVYLQAVIAKGQSQQVRYDDVSLTAVPIVAWSVPGGTVLDSAGLSAHVRFDGKGPQAVYANATDGGVRLWSAAGAFDVPNALPVASLAVPAETPINQPVVLDATGSFDADALLGLQDSAFANLGTAWQASAVEVGGALQATALPDPRGGVLVSVAGATKAGSVYVAQAIALGRTRPATLTVRVQDEGGLDGYAFLLRESNGTFRKDTVFAFPPAGDRERLLSMPWEPQLANATQLTVFLRFRMGPGADAQVRFVQPRLSSGLSYSWSVDGQPVAAGPDPTHALLPRAAGAHTVAVEVTDTDGASTSASAMVNYTDLGFAWGSPPPAVLPLAPPTPLALDTLRRGEGREDQLDNGDFAAGKQGWAFADTEIGGGGAWTVLQEGGRSFARLAARANQTGSVYLQQDADRLCTTVPCTFSFDYRSDAPLDVLLRNRNGTDAATPPTDLHLRLPASAAWRRIDQPWRLDADAGRLTAYLRMRLDAGQSGTADFRSVALQPTLRIEATATGPGEGRIANGTFAASAPGAYLLHAAVSNPYGQAGGFDRALRVLPVEAFPTTGGLGVRLGPGAGTVEALGPDGEALWSVDLANRSVPAGVPRFESGGQVFVRLPPGNGTLRLSSGGEQGSFALPDLRERLAGPLFAANASLARSGWNSVARVRVHTPDEAIIGGTATVTEAGRPVANASLAREGGDLVGEVRLPLDLARHDYVVAMALRDGWGAQVRLPDAALAVDANPVLGGALALLAATLLVAGLGLGHLLLRARRGR